MSNLTPQQLTIITHEFFPKRGGIAVYTEEMARAAVELGLQVQLWAPQAAELKTKRYPFSLQQMPLKGSLNWPCRLKLARLLSNQADSLSEQFLYLPEPGPIITACYWQLLGKLNPKRLILTLHGSEILRFTQTPHRRWLFGKLLKKCHRIGVVSDYSKSLLLNPYPELESQVRTVSGALRHDFAISPSPEPQSSPHINLLTVARIHPRKGQRSVIEAIGQLSAQLKEKIRYRIIGPVVKTDYQKQLEQLAHTHGVNVSFEGEIADRQLQQAYSESDIFIMTSEQSGKSVEGFGLVYLEAASQNLPVIATRTGGIPEAVLDQKTGILIEPRNNKALAKAIEQLAAQPALRKAMGSAGKAHAQSLSWARNCQALFQG